MAITPKAQDFDRPLAGPEPQPWQDQLRALVDHGEVDTVLLALTDMTGTWRGKALDATYFLRQSDAARPMCGYVLATDSEMSLLDDFALASLDTGLGDLHLVPVPDTLRVLPWRPSTALIVTDVVHPHGQPVAVAPRQVLHDQIRLLQGDGLTAQVGLEAEWTTYRGKPDHITRSERLTPVTDRSLDLSLTHPPEIAAYLRHLRTGLAQAGLPVRIAATEHGFGQFEINFPPADPLTAADAHLVLQDAVRHYARAAGWTALWMAAPTTEGATNGLHIHLSLSSAIGGPLSAAGTHGLPGLLGHAVAGLLDVLPDLAPLYAPTINSYKRFRPGSGAPVSYVWGWDNRTCAVRAITGHGGDVHLEVRLPGGDANAYLALAAVLAAVRHGIAGELSPPAPYTGNAYYGSTDVWPVPQTLHEALTVFQDSPIADGLFTGPVIAHYATAARHTVATHQRTVTDFDLRQGMAAA